ncbi:hypothetical protein BDV26DRAFT_257662 [Aspergillus bertholletiae]|uniref:Uncharacterized protein n=1 Tax=Aspergillus bertholletiae TaxID=1226010 RepID=A0A5N7BEW7_9EURO|nr:hypothetical protein BDV26DRAFT_257662 [Aspergillus bertholletiae]
MHSNPNTASEPKLQPVNSQTWHAIYYTALGCITPPPPPFQVSSKRAIMTKEKRERKNNTSHRPFPSPFPIPAHHLQIWILETAKAWHQAAGYRGGKKRGGDGKTDRKRLKQAAIHTHTHES